MQLFELFGKITIDSKTAEQEIDKVSSKAEGFGDKLGGLAGKVGKVGVGIAAGFATAAVGIGASAVKMTDDFNKSLNGLAAATGATDTEMAKLGDSIKSIYASNTGESFEDVAKSMATVKQQMQDLDGKELEEVTKNAIGLRDTFEFDVSESMRAVNSLTKQFGISSEEAFDLLGKGAQEGLNANGDMMDLFWEYSVQFKELGFSAEEMYNTFKIGAENGAFSMDILGDGIKETNILSKDGSDKSADAFTALGLNAKKMTADFAAGGEKAKAAWLVTTKALGGVKDKVKQNELGVALYGTKWEDLGAKAITALGGVTGNVEGLEGTMDRINQIKYNTFGEALEGIKRQLEVGLISTVGEKLMPVMNNFANFLTTAMPSIVSFLETTFTKIGNFITLLSNLFKNNSFLIDNFKDNIKEFVIVATTTLQTLVNTLTTFFTNFYTNNKELIDSVIANITGLITTIQQVLTMLFTFITSIFNQNKDAIMATWNALFTGMLAIFNMFVGTIKNILTVFKAIFTGDWKLLFDTIKAQATLAFTTLQTVFSSAFTVIKNGIQLAISTVVNLVKSIFNFNIDTKAFTDKILSPFKTVEQWIKSTWGGLTELIQKPFKALDGLKEKASGALAGAKEKVKGLKIPGFAKGTNNAPGGTALVGEKGPELVNLPKGSKVKTATKTEQTLKQRMEEMNAKVKLQNKDKNKSAQQMAQELKAKEQADKKKAALEKALAIEQIKRGRKLTEKEQKAITAKTNKKLNKAKTPAQIYAEQQKDAKRLAKIQKQMEKEKQKGLKTETKRTKKKETKTDFPSILQKETKDQAGIKALSAMQDFTQQTSNLPLQNNYAETQNVGMQTGTAQEVIVIKDNNFVIREEADIEKIARKLYELSKRNSRSLGIV